MGEKAKSLVESMKERINRSGNGKSVTFYLKKDGKCRIRFLQDMEEGMKVQYHDKFGEFSHPCLSYYGKPCPNCKNKDARHIDNFVWSVWNYETKRVELFMYKASKASPIPALISMYETYGTICDRDYVIQRNGEGFDTTYSVVPMDKKKFKGDEQPFSKKKTLKLLLEIATIGNEDEENDEEDEDEDEEVEVKKPKKSKATKKAKVVEEDNEDDEEEDDEDEEEEEPVKKSKKAKKSKKVEEEDEDEDEDLPPWEDDEDDE